MTQGARKPESPLPGTGVADVGSKPARSMFERMRLTAGLVAQAEELRERWLQEWPEIRLLMARASRSGKRRSRAAATGKRSKATPKRRAAGRKRRG